MLDKYEKAEVVKNFDRLNNLSNLSTTTAETEIELNFAVVKIKHKIIRKDER